MLWCSIRIARGGDSNRQPQHTILWRTSGNYEKKNLLFWSTIKHLIFNGYGGVYVMSLIARQYDNMPM